MLCGPTMYPDEDVPKYFSSPDSFPFPGAQQEDSELSGINFQELMIFSTQTCGGTF